MWQTNYPTKKSSPWWTSVDESAEGWIVEELTFRHLFVEHLPIVVVGDVADDVAVGGACLQNDKPGLACYNGKEYTVTAIGEKAFRHNDELQSVVMPSTIVSIGHDAFAYRRRESYRKCSAPYVREVFFVFRAAPDAAQPFSQAHA